MIKDKIIANFESNAPTNYIAQVGADILGKISNRVLKKGDYKRKIRLVFNRYKISHILFKYAYETTTREGIDLFIKGLYKAVEDERAFSEW